MRRVSFFVASGELYLNEFDKSVIGNELLGEIVVLSPEGKRMVTAICTTDCEFYRDRSLVPKNRWRGQATLARRSDQLKLKARES